MITLTSTEAQNRFGEILDAAQREPITITRRGRPLAFIISPEELKKLFASQSKRDEAVAAYEAYRQRIRLNPNPAADPLCQDRCRLLEGGDIYPDTGGLTTTADELTDEDVNRLVHELR